MKTEKEIKEEIEKLEMAIEKNKEKINCEHFSEVMKFIYEEEIISLNKHIKILKWVIEK